MTHTRLLPTLIAVSIVAACAVMLSVRTSPVRAQGRLRANVYMTQAQIPSKLTEKGLIGFARGHNAARLQESNEDQLDQRKWHANMVVAFNRSPGDLEFHVLFYDIHDGPRRFVEDMSTFVNDRSQKTFVQRIRLERPRFRPNRNMELVVTVRREEVGRQRFGLVGEEPRRSGEVSFTDEDTQEDDD